MTLQLLTLVAAAGGMALLALTHNAYAVYFMFSALVAVVLVSYASSRLSARALHWRREQADRVFENEPFTVHIDLTNGGRMPRFALTLRDTLPRFVESDDAPEFALPALWPRQRVTLSYRARARKRGVYALGPLSVEVSDPFGVFQRKALIPALGESVVYPRPVPLDGDLGRSALSARGDATGEHARAYESGLDFYGIRDYQPGDELRRIHWPATAHHGRLTVIEFDRSASDNLAVVLDTKAGTEFGAGVDTTLEVGVRAAASLLHWALASEGTGFLAVDSAEGPRWLGVDRLDREYELLELLARVEATGTMPVSAVAEWAARRTPAGATVCVVTAAPDAGLPAVLGAAARRQIRAAAVVLDAHSFDSRAGHPEEMIHALSAVGAATAAVRRGDNLQDALESVLLAGE